MKFLRLTETRVGRAAGEAVHVNLNTVAYIKEMSCHTEIHFVYGVDWVNVSETWADIQLLLSQKEVRDESAN